MDRFYERQMVIRIAEIFGNPQKPATVTQEQFDQAQAALISTASKEWHEVGQEDYWHYLNDLCYVDLQPDLFDYLFPAFLIRWWEGQLSRSGGPESETTLYRAIDHGQIFDRQMSPLRRDQVFAWMVDAYLEGIGTWGGCLSVHYDPNGPDNLHGPLSSFHALGQSVPIISEIWRRLAHVDSSGKAQWWLVLASGLAFEPDTFDVIPPWTPDGGGGGPYILSSDASIFDHGYLSENLSVLRSELTKAFLVDRLEEGRPFLSFPTEQRWSDAVLERMFSQPEYWADRLGKFLGYLGSPNLGGVLDDF